jgi:hypothetical protein
MKIARLTNLGNLTLRNLLRLDKEYRENAELKRAKLRKLWANKFDMGAFQEFFSSYHSNHPEPLAVEDSKESTALQRFGEMGLVRFEERTDALEKMAEDIQLDEYKNPARYVRSTTVELTGLCNLRCKHCYRGGSREGEHGLPADEIKRALEPLLRAGISYIMFTGGEPTLRKSDLLEVVDYASQFMELKGVSAEERLQYEFGKPNPAVEDILQTRLYKELRKQLMKQLTIPEDELLPGQWNICDKSTPQDVEKMLRDQAKEHLMFKQKPSELNLDSIAVLSNGFFEEQRELVRKLKSYGNVSMQTSLDSYDEETTDRNRGRRGVFAHVKSLAEISGEEEFDLSIQGHNLRGRQTPKSRKAYKIFNEQFLIRDIEGMLQLGNAVQNGFKTRDTRASNNRIGDLSSSKRHGDGWCKGFTRPDDIHIRPTGNVGNCLYAYAVPEEFGNLSTQSMAEIINGIQDTRVYQMFKDGRIEQYQHELDKSLFPKVFSKSCEPMILTLTYGVIKERLIEQGVGNPVQRANEEVAKIYKFKV